MCVGYLAYCGLVTNEDGIFDAYMDARQRLFGYPAQPPQLSILVPAAGEQRIVQVMNAPPGLVPTLGEAAQLLVEMQKRFPSRTWTMLQYSFPDADEIQWGHT